MQRPTLLLEVDDAKGCIDPSPLIIYQSVETRRELNMSSRDDHLGWMERSKQFIVDSLIKEKKVLMPLADDNIIASQFRATSDAFLLIPDMDPHRAAMGEVLNSIVAMPTTVFTAKLTGDFTEVNRNSRGNVKKMAKAIKLGTSNGLAYLGDRAQELQTMAVRYAVSKKDEELDAGGIALAKEIALEGFNTLIDVEKLDEAWDDITSSVIYNQWLDKAAQAGYSASHSLSEEHSERIVRFHGKQNFKAKEDLVGYATVFKAPQGISAWSKGANSFFGVACRIISDVIRRSLKPNCVWNNGMTVEEAAERFVKASLKVPTPENVRLDAEEMDSKQNKFTHRINYEFDVLLKVNPIILDLYYSMYEEYLLMAQDCSVLLKGVKPSGAPWTLKGNSILMVLLSLWLITGEGPLAIFFQGDDVDRNQSAMKLHETRLRRLAIYCAFKMQTEFGDYAAFCGFVLINGQLVPNIRRKLIKLIGTSFRSYNHFTQVQQSLRDYMKALRGLSMADIIEANAGIYGVSVEAAESWVEVIESLSHISKAQFEQAAMEVDINMKFLAQGRNGAYDRLETTY